MRPGDDGASRRAGEPRADSRAPGSLRAAGGLGYGSEFKIVDEATGEAVGSVGYWERAWRGEQVYETGWSVLPRFQGLGFAGMAAAQAISIARADGKHRFLHAFPSVDNPPSNALCRKLGFTLVGECEFEYPKGHFMRCNDWRLDLHVSS